MSLSEANLGLLLKLGTVNFDLTSYGASYRPGDHRDGERSEVRTIRRWRTRKMIEIRQLMEDFLTARPGPASRCTAMQRSFMELIFSVSLSDPSLQDVDAYFQTHKRIREQLTRRTISGATGKEKS